MNTVTIQHTGPEYISAIPDLPAKTINEIKSTKIVVKTIYFEGEGAITALTLTKSTIPYPIKQGQETTVTVTVENTGTTAIRDIEVKDHLPDDFDFVKGRTSGKYKELKPGESRAFQYVIKSRDAGKFILPQAEAIYADSGGNYHQIQSNAPEMEVILPLIATPGRAPTIPTGEERGIPEFEAMFAIMGLLAVAYLMRRR